MGTCWLLGAKTRLDLGWNLSAAADKGAGFCTRRGVKGGGDHALPETKDGKGEEGKSLKRVLRIPQQLLLHQKFESLPFTNTRGPSEQRGREAKLCNGAIVGS